MIELVQSPIIKQNLVELGKSVTDRLELLNIENQVATTETVKALKDIRIILNKEFTEFEEQRKFIKNGVLNPYNEFETIYKSEIQDKYKSAIELLKNKIAFVEDAVKDEKKKNIQSYFNELCKVEVVDFLKIENVGLDINLSTSEKKYKEQCIEFVDRVKDDLALIDTQEFKAEITVEYKKTLNASKAIKSVQDRKEAERVEIERQKIQLINNRKNALTKLGFFLDEMIKSYVFNDSIFITLSEVEELSKEEFTSKFLAFEEDIKALKVAIEQPKEEVQAPKAEPLQAAKEVIKEEVFTASFEVVATMKELKALKEYLINNNINYKNI